MPDLVSLKIHGAALDGQMLTNTWNHWEGDGIARAVLDVVVKELRAFAVERFDKHGPRDARGAAFWDAAGYVDETLIGDPLVRADLAYEASDNPSPAIRGGEQP